MSDFKARIEAYLDSSAHLSKTHVHPKLAKMFELGGMTAVFKRADGAYLFDAEGERYLDFLSGGGVHFIGRNHPHVTAACRDVLEMDLPNLSIVNASVLGGLVAEKLLGLTHGHMGKVIYANSGTEATDVMVRFARFVTRRRRFLYLDGSFHGRSFGAISLCGFPELKVGMDPLMPTTTPIPPNDLRRLRQELKHGDVAGFLFEPVQGLTGTVLDRGYLREAEILCRQYGTLLLADEVQTGLGRTGHWFRTTGLGIRPDMLSVSKTLSGGLVPVSAVLLTDAVYDRVYSKLTSGPIYFSTFAENNLAMTAALTTLEVLEDLDAPALAREKSDHLRARLAALQRRYDVIDHIDGDGLLVVIRFKDSGNTRLFLEQKALSLADGGAFAAAVNVALYRDHRVLVQIPGPGLDAIKILPPVTATEEDFDWFLDAFERTLEALYQGKGPLVTLGKTVASGAVSKVRELIPSLPGRPAEV